MFNDIKFLKRNPRFIAERHGFHLVRPSPWPFCTSWALFYVVIVILNLLNATGIHWIEIVLSFTNFFLIISFWFRDVVTEGTFQGKHTWKVQRGLRIGMILFLYSETMFFFGFFWAFFYFALSPSIWIGCTWPPVGIVPIDPFGLPLYNTILLISSGISANFSHKSMCRREGRYDVMIGLSVSIFLGICFTGFQLWEYSLAKFSINDGIYGSIFYMATGFHGLHVIIGTIALTVCLLRHIFYHFTVEHHVGFICSIWYWHFVDIIWIALYLSIYLWGYRW